MDRPRCFRYLKPPEPRKGKRTSEFYDASADERVREQTLMFDDYYGMPGTLVLSQWIGSNMQYWLMPSEEYALWAVANAPLQSMQYYYRIQSSTPVCLYADFDAPTHVFASYTEFRDATALCCAYLSRFLDALYGCRLTARHYDGQWRLFDSSTPDTLLMNGKWSMHAHTRLVFDGVETLHAVMQRFFALLGGELRRLDPRVGKLFYQTKTAGGKVETKCTMDEAVYNSRPFRLPHCRKNGRQRMPLRPLLPEATLQADVAWGFVHGSATAGRPELGPPPAARETTELPDPSDAAAALEVATCDTVSRLSVHSTHETRCHAATLCGLLRRQALETGQRPPVQEAVARAAAFAQAPDYGSRVALALPGLPHTADAAPAAGIEWHELWAVHALLGTPFAIPANASDADVVRAVTQHTQYADVGPVSHAQFMAMRSDLQQHANTTVRRFGMLQLFTPPPLQTLSVERILFPPAPHDVQFSEAHA